LNKVIWKYPLVTFVNAVATIEMPEQAEILWIDTQGDRLCLWAMHEPGAKQVSRKFVLKGTGWEFDDRGLRYIKTIFDGDLVWHLFERDF
jgi:hypothetical protein